MTDLHATAAQLICDVDSGHLLAATRLLRDLRRDELTDLTLIIAAQATPDTTMQRRSHGIDNIITAAVTTAAATHGVTPADIAGPSRHRNVTQARQIACWIAHDVGATYSAIGAVINRDHTTVMHGCRRVENSHALLAMARVIRDGAQQGAA